MRQRVSIARAFAIKPDILLCDEPFSALDEVTGNALRTEFMALLRETSATGIFITHSINEALQLGHRVLVFHRPARIAYVADLRTTPSSTERDRIRSDILRILASEATE
jgi:NitT/TauT family transport system ATP-binding protein